MTSTVSVLIIGLRSLTMIQTYRPDGKQPDSGGIHSSLAEPTTMSTLFPSSQNPAPNNHHPPPPTNTHRHSCEGRNPYQSTRDNNHPTHHHPPRRGNPRGCPPHHRPSPSPHPPTNTHRHSCKGRNPRSGSSLEHPRRGSPLGHPYQSTRDNNHPTHHQSTPHPYTTPSATNSPSPSSLIPNSPT